MRILSEWAKINKIKIKKQRKVSNLGGGNKKFDNLYEFQVI